MRLIDADALIKTIRENDYLVVDYFNSKDRGMFTSGIMQAIDEQPTIEPERERGEWIDDYDPVNFGEFRYKCSKCGARTVEWADNFCYRCGADMRGEEDD